MKKRKITDNIPLKIMSVAIAVVLWLIVVNIDNPTGTNYYTLNDVELINKEYVESSDTIGKMCMPEQNQDSIKVAITATKKIRDKIKVTDISAVADLQQAVSLDTNPVMVPITVTCSVPGVSPSDIKVTPQNLSVNLDEKETQEFVVNGSRGDTKPGKDYEVGSLTASPEKVKFFYKMGIDSVVCALSTITSIVEQQAFLDEFTTLLPLSGGQLRISELRLPASSPVIGKTLGELQLSREVIIATILRADQPLVPHGDTRLAAQDVLILIAAARQEAAAVKVLTGR